MSQLLANIFWHALSGPQAQFAAGSGKVRRYARGFSPIVAFADPERPDFAALARYCSPGERFYCDGWSGTAPADWHIAVESTMEKMLWQGETPKDDAALDAIPLGPQHAPAALALAELTHPGPFGLRTLELGEYFGYFDDERLVAMAGERSAAAGLREISGVCTHPDYQGRGLARRLTLKLIRRELARGETPFLHVMSGNHTARLLYHNMGFAQFKTSVVRVIEPR
jgi:ribosomal protein S18 acetylase RimI-like enzyme